MQWVPDPSQKSVDNLNNARRKASKYFRDIKKAYLKPKIEELENKLRSKILGPCIGASMNLRRVTSLELI